MTLEVRLAEPGELPDVYALRHEVFVVGQDVPEDLERDEYDVSAEHVVARDDTGLVGTGRLVDGRIDEGGRREDGTVGRIATIGRMAVRADVRRSGIGRALLDRLVEQARGRGLPCVELHAQLHARDFYERAGFAPVGEVYLEAGIEHVVMRREL